MRKEVRKMEEDRKNMTAEGDDEVRRQGERKKEGQPQKKRRKRRRKERERDARERKRGVLDISGFRRYSEEFRVVQNRFVAHVVRSVVVAAKALALHDVVVDAGEGVAGVAAHVHSNLLEAGGLAAVAGRDVSGSAPCWVFRGRSRSVRKSQKVVLFRLIVHVLRIKKGSKSILQTEI